MAVESIGVLLWAAVCGMVDFRQRRIPNALTLGGFAVALSWLVIEHRSVLGADWMSVLAALGLALAMTVPAWIRGLLGAGDVKYLAAFAVMGGWWNLIATIVGAGVAAIVALMIIYLGGRYPVSAAHGTVDRKRRFIPMGVLFSCGVAVALIYAPFPGMGQ